MKVVKFKRHYAQYTPGDVAGFEDEHAARLVDAGIADASAPEPKEAKASQKAETGKAAAAKG
ncbi:hypothetical protein WS58_06450 [Burkholderia pseudomultivorans]|uniref:hypothetical protein n=1 Tax=Burkholderia pseudomultivorans TaxID=1207504 RepID=UPI0007561409|nr:hypothetical protein [Burkholderia pseudomultivorans]AOI89773.1 hypothetical protein WS57_09280 [Burkholderia pseudomultivorans]KVC29329.1 hypothetical protein WS56_19715 [Burkholderia pseudomultivorans]KVC34625.1 hypothetical protein WS55_33530 [Burkholderia pseudomultivorans]KVC49927.1 hypothetical protein WS58_06450 [Burkholderia pseudomultivorans]